MTASKRFAVAALVTLVLAVGGTAPAFAIQECGNNRWIGNTTAFSFGSGPRGFVPGQPGSKIGCDNAKRIFNYFTAAVGEIQNYGAHPGFPFGCDTMAVRVFTAALAYGNWVTAPIGGYAQSALTGSVLGAEFRMDSVYGAAQWSAGPFYSTTCPVD